eukprot:2314067-Amphidinium_carterae.3
MAGLLLVEVEVRRTGCARTAVAKQGGGVCVLLAAGAGGGVPEGMAALWPRPGPAGDCAMAGILGPGLSRCIAMADWTSSTASAVR